MADEPTNPSNQNQSPSPEEKPEEKKEEPTSVEQPPEQKPEEDKQSEQPKEEETPETPAESPPTQPESPPQEPPKTEEPKPTEEKKEEEKQEEAKPAEEEPPQSSQQPEPPKSPEPEVKKEAPGITQEDVNKQIAEKLKEEQDERRKLANEARAKKKEDNLNRLLGFAKEQKVITNDGARDFLHISQSTATNYLSELVKSGKLKREGQRGGTKYSA